MVIDRHCSLPGDGGDAENLVLLGEKGSGLHNCNGPKEVGGGGGEGCNDCLIDGTIAGLVSGEDTENRDFGGVLLE